MDHVLGQHGQRGPDCITYQAGTTARDYSVGHQAGQHSLCHVGASQSVRCQKYRGAIRCISLDQEERAPDCITSLSTVSAGHGTTGYRLAQEGWSEQRTFKCTAQASVLCAWNVTPEAPEGYIETPVDNGDT